MFFSSIVILIPNGKFLDCVNVAFREKYVLKGIVKQACRMKQGGKELK